MTAGWILQNTDRCCVKVQALSQYLPNEDVLFDNTVKLKKLLKTADDGDTGYRVEFIWNTHIKLTKHPGKSILSREPNNYNKTEFWLYLFFELGKPEILWIAYDHSKKESYFPQNGHPKALLEKMFDYWKVNRIVSYE